jgi:hypothetical protein
MPKDQKAIPALLFGVQCRKPLREIVGYMNARLERAVRGFEVEGYSFEVEAPLRELWWTLPTDDSRLSYLLMHARPSMSKNQALEWIETDEFVRYVRSSVILPRLNPWAANNAGIAHGFDQQCFEAVKAVIFGESVPTSSTYLRRVFDGWFPNACYFSCARGSFALEQIWTPESETSTEDGQLHEAS